MKKNNITEVCSRCGSPRGILKSWKETIETSGGHTSEIEITQTICTNVDCQEKFEKDRAVAIKRQEELVLQKKERDELRKSNAFSQAQEARKAKIKNKLT